MTDLTAASSAPAGTLLDDTDASPLFQPADVAGLHLRNRLVMAPMTRQFSPGGIPGEDVVVEKNCVAIVFQPPSDSIVNSWAGWGNFERVSAATFGSTGR